MRLYASDLPDSLAGAAQCVWDGVLERTDGALADELTAALANSPEWIQLPRLLACSPVYSRPCATQARVAIGVGIQWLLAAIPTC